MANAALSFGIRPIGQNGTEWTGQGRMYCIPASQATAIFLGDPLIPLGGTDAFGVPLVGLASAGAGNPILGSMYGVCNGPAGSGVTITRDVPVYHLGSTLGYILVSDAGENLF